MQVPTGGIAHEPQGRFGVTPRPTVIVWMKEDEIIEIFGYRTNSEYFQ